MSLYQVQKLIYRLNRDPRMRERYASEREAVLVEYEPSDEERASIVALSRKLIEGVMQTVDVACAEDGRSTTASQSCSKISRSLGRK